MISVVVSIFNVEKYLDKCISCFLNQTYQDFELLLVDDGSPDNCPAMCDNWAKKDTRIRVFHKPNGGLDSARNCGIDNANGDLIIFPDPDDWVNPNYLEQLLSIKEKYDADLSICGHYYGDQLWNKTADTTILNTNKALKELMLPYSYNGYVWNKLYSLNLIRTYNLRFDEDLHMCEDLLFNVIYFQHCKRVVYDPTPVYHYVINPNSVTSSKSPLTPRKLSGLTTYKKIAALTHNHYPELEGIAYSTLAKLCLNFICIYYQSKTKDKDTLDLLSGNFRKYRKYFYNTKVYPKHDKRCAKFAVIHPFLYYKTRSIYLHFRYKVFKKPRF
ncbi:MAG: glycosyltransferase [Lachnospiraceae bacterium]|nr:glycosyltransferase [Lachnospiraceae bacterium]